MANITEEKNKVKCLQSCASDEFSRIQKIITKTFIKRNIKTSTTSRPFYIERNTRQPFFETVDLRSARSLIRNEMLDDWLRFASLLSKEM